MLTAVSFERDVLARSTDAVRPTPPAPAEVTFPDDLAGLWLDLGGSD